MFQRGEKFVAPTGIRVAQLLYQLRYTSRPFEVHSLGT